ncbi:hypothetical protein ACKI19_44870, partial [Streptomyces caniscabiei]|uniref:hypothetical protein n=1 Tax=Streptomyces caniscabiei TaxID=2746961 RepID=UPI0038F75831
VNSLVEELDNLQWDVQDRVDTGDADAHEHLYAFSRARAAEDPRSAAMEGLYEAAIAIDDLDSLRDVIEHVVS